MRNRILKTLTLALLAALWPALSLAQSSPGFVFGQIPTATQWNGYFAGKLDYPLASGLSLTNGTSNVINWGAAGLGAPTFTSRSAGAKTVLYQTLDGSHVDYGTGVQSNYMWLSVPQALSSQGWKFYGGTTLAASLDGIGDLSLNGTGTISLNAAALPAQPAGTALTVAQADGTGAVAMVESFGAVPASSVARADGTAASPTQVLSGEQIGSFNYRAWAAGSANWQSLASLRGYAAENIDATHHGSKLCLATTPLASTTLTESLCQLADGGLTVGTPTGGDKGAGTINTTGVFVNGVSVGTGGVSTVFGRSGTITANSGDYTCAQVTNCPPIGANNSWTGQNSWEAGYPTSTYPIIRATNGDGIVGPRSQTMLQIVGASDFAAYSTYEVNVVDAFAYNGFAQYDAERYDRGGPNNGRVQSGEPIGTYSFEPYDGISDATTAGMQAVATETQINDTNHGTDLIFIYTPTANGATKRLQGMAISRGGTGGVEIGTPANGDMGAGSLDVSGNVATDGHFRGTGGTPTPSVCGGSTMGAGSTDVAGTVNLGGSCSSVTLTFVRTWGGNGPICWVQNYNNFPNTAYVTGYNATTLTISYSPNYTGTTFYGCTGTSP